MQKYLEAMIGPGILAIAIILGTFFLSRSNLIIQNTGGVMAGNQPSNSISVTGNGKVYAKPDTITITITSSNLAPTTKEAQAKVNEQIDQVIKIAKQNGIDDKKDIQTTNISIQPEYDWASTSRIFKGQRASQSLEIKVRKIESDTTKATNIIDSVTSINGIEVGYITYDIEDKTSLYTQARELAFKKAEQKAKELANLGRVEIIKPISISDSVSSPYYPYVQSYTNSLRAEASAGNSSSLPTGQLELSIDVSIVYGIK